MYNSLLWNCLKCQNKSEGPRDNSIISHVHSPVGISCPIMALTVCVLSCVTFADVLVCLDFLGEKGFRIRTRFGVGRSRAVRTVEFDSRHPLDTLTSPPYRCKKATPPVLRLQPYNELLHVSEEGKLERATTHARLSAHHNQASSQSSKYHFIMTCIE